MQQPSDIFTAVSVLRYAGGGGEYVDGVWVAGTPSAVSITAAVQPMPPERMALLPEGQRGSAGIIVYTDTELLAVNETDGTKGDKVTWKGDQWEVVSVEDLTTGMTLEERHYEVLAVRQEA